jgi:HemY protein
MKRLLLLIAVVLVAGGVAARWLMADAGYVLVIHGPWELETSLGFALLMLAALVVAVAVLTLVLTGLWRRVSPAGVRRRISGPVARRRLQLGFLALTEADYNKAERLFKAATVGDWPLAAWLGAARAAAGLGDTERAHEHLEQARGCEGGVLPAALQAARMDHAAGELGRARRRLEELADQHPDHPERVRLLCEILEREADWDALARVLPRLDDDRDPALARLQRRLWLALLRRAGEQHGESAERVASLRAYWKRMPAFLQRDPALVARYAGYLAQSGDGEEALRLVRKALEREWDDRLPPVLEAIEEVPPEKLLEQLETWLENRAGNGPLLLTAGRVALRARFWGKARSFFRAALSSSRSETARVELARLLDALGETAEARRCRDEALAEAVRELPRLPLPSPGETG